MNGSGYQFNSVTILLTASGSEVSPVWLLRAHTRGHPGWVELGRHLWALPTFRRVLSRRNTRYGLFAFGGSPPMAFLSCTTVFRVDGIWEGGHGIGIWGGIGVCVCVWVGENRWVWCMCGVTVFPPLPFFGYR